MLVQKAGTCTCMLYVLIRIAYQGISNECTKHIIVNIKKKITLNYSKYNNVCSYEIFFQGTQKRIQNSRGKRVIHVGVRATEVLL